MAFETLNPATGEKLRTANFASENDVEMAIAKLHQSFKSWQQLSYSERQRVLKSVAVNLAAKSEFFAGLMTLEMGKPIKESRLEVKKCVQSIEAMTSADLDELLAAKHVSSIYKDSQISHAPLGVIYGVMPWNFPLWQVVRMVIPALLAGNVILLKHSEITSQTGDEFEKLLASVWEHPLLLHRMAPHEMTEKIMRDARVHGISLTGSTRAGQAVAQAAAASLKKYVLELGGSDPYLVLKDADINRAAKIITQSRLLNTGQSCICAKRCIVHQSQIEPMLHALTQEFSQYHFGNPQDEKTDLGPLAHPRFKAGLAKQLAEFKNQVNPKQIFSKSPNVTNENSAFVASEIYLLPKNSDWLHDQEFFAPVLIVIPFQTDEEAIKIANSTEFGLGGGVFTADLGYGQKMASQIIAGQVAINDLIRSDVSLPFGGFKKSGVGRELGDAGYFEFTQTKVVSNS